MIPRYTRPDMAAIWSDQARFETWWRVELAVLEVRAERGEVPLPDLEVIRARARFSPEEIARVEETVQHDVVAFLSVISEHVGPASRHIHRGLTSSDVLDTGLALQLAKAIEVLQEDLRALRRVLCRRALEFRDTPCMARTHGIHAEATTFGMRWLVWDQEFLRHEARLASARERLAVGKCSGAVGVFGHTDLELEEAMCARLGLAPAKATTQVIQRDRHAELLLVLALIGASVEKIATEIRHLQRTEVGEAFEPFGKGQKGSSAMPHKRNPILSERLCGMARLLRGYALVGLENLALWHERDISHSSAERVVLPDATIALDYMLHILTRTLKGLEVDAERMQQNLEMTKGLAASEALLLALTDAGWMRERAYEHVQKAAQKVWQGQGHFSQAVRSDLEIVEVLGESRLQTLLDVRPPFEKIRKIYQRAGLTEERLQEQKSRR
ncbi:MAG: adenylosuccinate lyase [bacterium]